MSGEVDPLRPLARSLRIDLLGAPVVLVGQTPSLAETDVMYATECQFKAAFGVAPTIEVISSSESHLHLEIKVPGGRQALETSVERKALRARATLASRAAGRA